MESIGSLEFLEGLNNSVGSNNCSRGCSKAYELGGDATSIGEVEVRSLCDVGSRSRKSEDTRGIIIGKKFSCDRE